MVYLLLSIICNVSVGFVLKVLRSKKSFGFFQMITWNYFFAAILSYCAYKPDLAIQSVSIPWTLIISLTILLPSIFLIQANSIKYMGIIKTDIAQRLSLLISLSAAYFIFKENFSTLKIIGLFTGLLSIFFVLYKEKSEKTQEKWIYPVLVFLGFGVIDILFKKVSLIKEYPYTTNLFIIFVGAFLVSFLILLSQIKLYRQQFNTQNIYWGFGLGILNFGNILFYLKAHQLLSNSPSTVFICMNFGVIILGSLLGIIFFKEKMNKFNYIGLLLALIALIFISISQINQIKR